MDQILEVARGIYGRFRKRPFGISYRLLSGPPQDRFVPAVGSKVSSDEFEARSAPSYAGEHYAWSEELVRTYAHLLRRSGFC